jgi:hypothetical protein
MDLRRATLLLKKIRDASTICYATGSKHHT